eukprot:SM000046S16365  [mRNA]  locus=s46:277348:280468:+ [translate_table: standard]
MACCGFSFLRAYRGYLAWHYRSCGLAPVQVRLDEQTSIHCWVPTKRRDRPSLLFLHGFGAGALVQWDKQVRQFSKHFDIYLPDLVFFGSSHTTGSERSTSFQAECCMKLMKHFDVDRYSVLGYSYGGEIAYNLALAYPATVEKVTIMASALLATPEDFKEAMLNIGVEDLSGFYPRDTDGVRRMLKLAYYNPPRVPECILRDVLKDMFDSGVERKQELGEDFRKRAQGSGLRQLGVLQQEVLLIWGELDPICPPKQGQLLKEHLHQQPKLVIIPKTKHMPHAERPTEFCRAVFDFYHISST